MFERVLQGERINNCGEHAHLVGGDAVHGARGPGHAAENIASTHHNTELHARPRYLSYFGGQLPDAIRINAECGGAGHHFAAELQQNALVLSHQFRP